MAVPSPPYNGGIVGEATRTYDRIVKGGGASNVNPIVYLVTRKINLFLYQNFKTVCGKDKIFTDNVRKMCGNIGKCEENVRKMCGNLGKSRIVKYHKRMNGLHGAWIAIRS